MASYARNLALFDESLQAIRSCKKWFAAAENVLCKAVSAFSRCWRSIAFIEEIGEANNLSNRIDDCDVQVFGIHQIRNDGVNALVEFLQIWRRGSLGSDLQER